MYSPEVWQLSGTTVHTGSCDKAGSLYSAPYSADHAKELASEKAAGSAKAPRLLGPGDDKAPAVFARLDDRAQSVRIRRRIFGDSGLFTSLKQLLEAIVPVRMSI